MPRKKKKRSTIIIPKGDIAIPVKTRPLRSGIRCPPAKPPTRREISSMLFLIFGTDPGPSVIRFPRGHRFLADFRYAKFVPAGRNFFSKPPFRELLNRKIWTGKMGYQYHVFRLRKEVHSIQVYSEARRQFTTRFQNWIFTQRSLKIARRNDRARQRDFERLARGENPDGWPAPRHRWERAMYHIVNVPLTLLWKANKIYWNCYWARRKKRVNKWSTLTYFFFGIFLPRGKTLWTRLYTLGLTFLANYGHRIPRRLPSHAELLRFLKDGNLSGPVRHRYLYGKGNLKNRIWGQTFYPQPPSPLELLSSGYPLRLLLSLGCYLLFPYLAFKGFLLGDPILCFVPCLILARPQFSGLNHFLAWADYLLVLLEILLLHILSIPRTLAKYLKWHLFLKMDFYLSDRHRPELYRWWRRKLKKFETPEDYAYSGQRANRRFKIENESWELRLLLGEWGEWTHTRNPRHPKTLFDLHPPITFTLLPLLLFLSYVLFVFSPTFEYYALRLMVLVLTVGLRPPF